MRRSADPQTAAESGMFSSVPIWDLWRVACTNMAAPLTCSRAAKTGVRRLGIYYVYGADKYARSVLQKHQLRMRRLCEEARCYSKLYNASIKQYKDSQMCNNIYMYQTLLSKAIYIAFKLQSLHFISSCFPWESNPWSWLEPCSTSWATGKLLWPITLTN